MKLEVTCDNPRCPHFLDKIEYYREEIDINYEGFKYDVQEKKEIKWITWLCPHCKVGYKWKLIKREDEGTDTPK